MRILAAMLALAILVGVGDGNVEWHGGEGNVELHVVGPHPDWNVQKNPAPLPWHDDNVSPPDDGEDSPEIWYFGADNDAWAGRPVRQGELFEWERGNGR
jgi:hypothetical protein